MIQILDVFFSVFIYTIIESTCHSTSSAFLVMKCQEQLNIMTFNLRQKSY